MPDGGSLVTTSATTAGAVELEIADTGPALSDEARHESPTHPRRKIPASRGNRSKWFAASSNSSTKHLGRQLP